MPTYDYRCKACGHALEIFHGITEKPRKTCPKCKKQKLERLISAGAGLVFKGSGFYLTDYRSKSYSEAAKKDSAPAAPAAETKPAEPPPKPAASESPAPKKPGRSGKRD
ncbi:MAG: zinc ribbon domain-containing protein [Planctomycetes bacterium]|nr:zinc ribbon domain-containing protein [Planctomycetota bacterium]